MSVTSAVRIAGMGLCLLSFPFILWMFKHIGLNLTTTVQTHKDHELITSGPYHWIRHPLYTFAGVFFLGLSIAIMSWTALLGILVGGIMLRVRLPYEEQGLIDKFGEDYITYKARTGAFLPRWSSS